MGCEKDRPGEAPPPPVPRNVGSTRRSAGVAGCSPSTSWARSSAGVVGRPRARACAASTTPVSLGSGSPSADPRRQTEGSAPDRIRPTLALGTVRTFWSTPDGCARPNRNGAWSGPVYAPSTSDEPVGFTSTPGLELLPRREIVGDIGRTDSRTSDRRPESTPAVNSNTTEGPGSRHAGGSSPAAAARNVRPARKASSRTFSPLRFFPISGQRSLAGRTLNKEP